MTFVMRDELFDAQMVRALSYTAQRGADVGECLTTAQRIGKVDADLWYREWSQTGERAASAAEALAASRPNQAREAWFRAANYLRTAGLFLMGSGDDRFRESSHRQTELFRRGAALLPRPAEVLEIPYEGTHLPAYFFRAGDDETPRPTMILTNGYDGTVEELYFANAAAALERGYHVLAFDGPGQGSVILDQGIPFRPDWEAVVTPVVDYALTRPEVDPDRLVLQGWSFGGYLAPRAATAEHRLAACISDCGPYDLWDMTVSRIPRPLAAQLPDGNPLVLRLLGRIMTSLMSKPTAGWALRRNLWVHGVDDPIELIRLSTDYTLKGREHLIRCPTYVSAVEGDDLSLKAEDFAAKLTCEHEYRLFTTEDGVSGHCEMAGRAVFHDHVFRWLDQVLPPQGS